MVRLAEPERQADQEPGSDVTDDILRNRLGVAEYLRHLRNDPGNYGNGRPESGLGRLSHLSSVTKAQQRRASLRDVQFNSGVTALLLAKYVRRVGGG